MKYSFGAEPGKKYGTVKQHDKPTKRNESPKKKTAWKKTKKNQPNGSRVALVPGISGSALVALSQERPERNERGHGPLKDKRCFCKRKEKLRTIQMGIGDRVVCVCVRAFVCVWWSTARVAV